DQLIAAEGCVSDELIDLFNSRFYSQNQRFMHLRRWEVGNEPIRVGQLNGNNFRIVVRNLAEQFVQRFNGGSRYTFQFLNYYDTQRFGVSRQLKLSHLIGRALINEDFDTAFELLAQSGTPESLKTLNFSGSCRQYFSELSPQLLKF